MANTELDVNRHMALFDPYKFGNKKVHIIGAGATGSWLTLQLAKLGISNIHVYDFDVVEMHNVPNQLFGLQHVGMKKVEALKEIIQAYTALEIQAHDEEVSSKRFDGYVFVMVDSMEARKNIFEQSIKMKTAIDLMVEPRMGLNEARVYNVLPLDLSHVKAWESNWYPDSEAEVSACGNSQSVITTALLTASICARQLINHFNGEKLHNEILVDCIYNAIYPTKW